MCIVRFFGIGATGLTVLGHWARRPSWAMPKLLPWRGR
jgi:hypothetical protein